MSTPTLVGAIFFSFFAITARADVQTFRYGLLFNPAENGVFLEKQRIDYDLSQGRVLSVGPYRLTQDAVELRISKSFQEVDIVEFGLEKNKKRVPAYVISFNWPLDYLRSGLIEVINDKGVAIWKRSVTDLEISNWDLEKPNLDPSHRKSVFGFLSQNVVEFPILNQKEIFRFCVSREHAAGRTALCSKRYRLDRQFGKINLISVSKNVSPLAMVNDKNVVLRGTAIFLDNQTPLKFSALLSDGTYYEFVSMPKEIGVTDMIVDEKTAKIELIGFGADPSEEYLLEYFYSDPLNEGLLNFMPTIGDTRKYWRAQIDRYKPYIYLRGEGGFPFRQNFHFESLPTKNARVMTSALKQKQTYSNKTNLIIETSPNVRLSSATGNLQNIKPGVFNWTFLSETEGEMNKDSLLITGADKTHKGYYQIFRGYPGEISGRLTGILSDSLDVVVMAELAGQYWFERFLGSSDYKTSLMRWGVAVKYFQNAWIANEDDINQSIVDLKVTNLDIKYRASPGVWQRDPTVGAVISAQQVSYSFKSSGESYTSENSMFGGGIFWARSMPKVFDDFLNIAPFMRYPKWTDVEFIYYPFPFEPQKTLIINSALNFHGKVQWTKRFFGEAGFGLKTFNYKDRTLGTNGLKIGLSLAYGTVGIGYNF